MNVDSPSRLTSRDAPLAAFLALLLFGIYIFNFDGTLHSTDGLSMFAVAENLVKHSYFDTHQLTPLQKGMKKSESK
ncbi:MAG TPA: hypothetical protein G4N96_12290, partial [Chloroflexi bacterium]|nr:hypothetical protein [Chloroflexota bacterium]